MPNNCGYGRGRPKVLDGGATEKMYRMKVEDGATYEEIGREFGITKAGVHSRLKQKYGNKLGGKVKEKAVQEKYGVSDAEMEFCRRAVVGTNEYAARAINPEWSVPRAKAVGAEMRRREDIRGVIRELMEIKGIGLEKRIERLADHIRSEDGHLSLRAIEASFKIDGSLSMDIKTEQTINIGFDLSAYEMRPAVVEVKEVKE